MEAPPQEQKIAKLERTRSHQSYVTSKGVEVPGVTTILNEMAKPALINWAWNMGKKGLDYKKVSGQAADIGSIAHFLCECYLKNLKPDLSDYATKDIEKAMNAFQKFVGWWDRQYMTLVESECQLVSDNYLYGGTIDCMAKDQDGQMVLVDFKTSKGIYDDYWYQVAAYSKLWTECKSSLVTRHIIVRIGKEEEGDFEFREKGDLKPYLGVFHACRDLYYAKKGVAGK